MRFFTLLGLLCALAWSQDTTAALDGMVTDPSGAAVRGPTVQATNADNGYTRAQETGATGAYRLILPAGRYDISIAAPGFASHQVRAVDLSVSQTVRLDAQLQVAKGTDSVDVSAGAVLVETSYAVGNVVTGRELVDLPLNGRNLSLLKNIVVRETVRLQFRTECFNVANHASFATPDNDIASPNFGRALQAGSPRLFQFGLKLVY